MLIDKAFSKTTQELRRDHYLMKDTMTLDEAEEYCENLDHYESYFVPSNSYNHGHDFSAEVFVYKENKPYKHASVRIYSHGFGIDQKEFFEEYEGKPIKIVSLEEKPFVEKHGKDIIDIVFKTNDDIYNKHDYQNYLTLRACEDEWLEEPNDDF